MEEEKVKIEDRDPKVNEFMCLLRMAGFNISYQSTDVVYDLFQIYQQVGSNINIKDILGFLEKKENEWSNYFKNQQQDAEIK